MTTRLVGIAGGSGSGKTTIAKALSANYTFDRLRTIPLDAYYRDRKDMPVEARGQINYDHPEAFDQDLLLEHVRQLKAGNAIEQPVYDYATHTRSDVTVAVTPSPVIVIEGILVLAMTSVVPLFDLKLYVETPADVRILRRLRRDVAERGRTVDSVIDQYLQTVRPMHDQFIEPSRRVADIVLPGEGDSQRSIGMLRAWVDSLPANLT
jgi:uridine kinase